MGRERCVNCKNISWVGLDIMYAVCDLTEEEIPWPLFMRQQFNCNSIGSSCSYRSIGHGE